MSTRKDTFLGSGVGKWTTIMKRHQYKEDLPIPKFCASLPDLSAIGWHAMPARKHWQQEKEPGFVVGSWKWCHEKPLLLVITTSETQNQCWTKVKGTSTLSQSIFQSTLTWSLRYGFSKCNALFSSRKLCYNGNNISTWYNIGFQFLTFSS